MPEVCRHFNQPAEILCLTSSSMSPFFCSTDPKYRKVSFWTNLPRVFQIECPHYITVFTLARTMRWEETLSFSCWRILAFTSASSHKVQSLYLLSCPRPAKFLMWVPMLWSWTISEAWIGDATNIWHLWNSKQQVAGAGNLCAEHDILILVLLHAFCVIHSEFTKHR